MQAMGRLSPLQSETLLIQTYAVFIVKVLLQASLEFVCFALDYLFVCFLQADRELAGRQEGLCPGPKATVYLRPLHQK